MVIQCRVDERMLHGQVAVTWMNQLMPDSILIANDEVVNNEMSKMALKMVKPENVKMAIRSVDDGAKVLNDPRAAKIKVFVIVRTIQDAVSLVKQTNEVKNIVIGGVRKKEGSHLMGAAVYLNDADIASLKELNSLCSNIVFQMVPADTPKTVEEILKAYESKGKGE